MKRSILTVAAVLAAGCGAPEPGAVERSADPAAVEVSRPARAANLRTFPATVVAREEADLATRMAGTILEVRADVGSVVRAGDTLVVLDGADVTARAAAAGAALELATRSHTRVENLARDGAASEQELDQARAALAAAEAGWEEARAQSRYTTLTAPFAGTVTRRLADPGDLAAPGRPLLRLSGAGDLEVEADLPGDLAGRVARGDTLVMVGGSTQARTPVVVSRVSPALEPGSRRFQVKARFVDPDAPRPVSGSYVRLGVPRLGSDGTWVPRDALVRRGQMAGVFVVQDGELRLRWVRLGTARGDAVELLAGPPEDSPVVRRPAPDLYDGRPVGRVTETPWSPADARADADDENDAQEVAP